MFIFRNYTIELLFDEDTRFSGYGDISKVPEADSYAWFYNAPVSVNREDSLTELGGISDKLRLIAKQIPPSKPFYIFTLENLFPVKISETDRSIANAIAAVNDTARAIAATGSNVRIVDFGEFLQEYKPSEWINWRFYFISQMVINPVIAPTFKAWWASKVNALTQPRKKCLVLDLDNTLWSGVLGEDGISGIKMSGDYPGNVYMYFQEGLVSLSKSGVILALCSKNNEEDVKELWAKNPFLRLRPEHIAAYRINWHNKADNIRELAKELNIGLDSMVFVDDNPTERELIRQQLPMVSVPDFPKKPYGLMEFYQKIVADYFYTYRLTGEDAAKTEQYKANALRASEQAKYTDLTDFIRSLDIHIDILKADGFNIPRIAQMTQKTNQFNLTTKRYSEADINGLVASGAKIYCISVSDKFGDNGITGTIIITSDRNTADIDSLLLSCRILGKDIESAFVKAVLNELLKDGIKQVTATYIPTLKNAQVSCFYEKVGFSLIAEQNGIKSYMLELKDTATIPNYYTLTIK